MPQLKILTRFVGFSALKMQLLPQLTEDFRENLIIQWNGHCPTITVQ